MQSEGYAGMASVAEGTTIMKDTFAVHVLDDDAGVRESIKGLLQEAGYDVHCHAHAESFLDKCVPAHGCALIDLRLAGDSGLTVQKEMIARQSPLRVVMMSAYGDIPDAVKAMRQGAADFIEKPFDPDYLLERIGMLADAVTGPEQLQRSARQQAVLIDTLTPRERQVLQGIVDGLANKQVAAELNISSRTVETHRVHIMQKLQADSLAHLVRIWIDAGQYVAAAPE